MRSRLLSILPLLLAACGDDPKPPVVAPAAPTDPATVLRMPERRKVEVDAAKQEAVKQRLIALFTLVKSGPENFARGAEYVVYRGEDPARKRWHEVCDYARDKEHVDEVLSRIGRLMLKSGEPVFDHFEAQKESEGIWLAWVVKFGEGEKAKKVLIACLEIDGKFAIGDIDNV